MPLKILFIVFLLIPVIGYSHSGRTNAEGCHTDKKTGESHCHSKPAQSKAQKKATLQRVIRVDYEGFTIWLDCEKRGAIKFRYNAQRDTANHKRHSKFYLDGNQPAECRQTSVKAYGKKFDRGHLVPANHLDYSKKAIKHSNFMINILPQAAGMNRGAWLQTEEIIECYRDIDELLVIGGVIWGNNKKDDYFLDSHGVRTPDSFWKVIIRGTGADQRAIAWLIPNVQQAKRKKLDDYLIDIATLEKKIGEKIPVADYAKGEKPASSWLIPQGCDKS